MWRIAIAGARANRASMAGTGVVVALAAALLSVTGVLMESGVRAEAGVDGGLLVALASSFAGTALVVVVMVTAATATLALRRRRREFALLRTIGASPGQVRRLISIEVLVLSAVVAPLGAVAGLFLARLLDPLLVDAGIAGAGYQSTLSPLPVVAAVLVVAPTALVASRLAARETVRIAPTAAIRDSALEPSSIGPVRRGSAVLTAISGLAAAFTPLFLPGTAGSAFAATSAFLLIGSAALAGPVLVAWAFGRAVRHSGVRGGAPVRLAMANLSGFSRRLTTVVVPLALVVAVGTTQFTIERALGDAAAAQLRAAIGTDIVASPELNPEARRGADQEAALAELPGVTGIAWMSYLPAQVRTDNDDLPDSLVWESTQALAIPADVDSATFDPGVREGSLRDLDAEDTIAISADAAFELQAGLGDSVALRFGTDETTLRVVAVYDRGLGVGDYLVGPDVTPTAPSDGLALIDISAPAASALPALTDQLRALGLHAMTVDSYVASGTSADAATQHLSTVLTMLLLLFLGLGAANALALITAGRRQELTLLHRAGTTRRQLLAMTGAESLLTGVAACLIGTLAVTPAVLGVSFGLLGPVLPAVDLGAYLLFSGAVLVLTVSTTLVAATRTVRMATSPTA